MNKLIKDEADRLSSYLRVTDEAHKAAIEGSLKLTYIYGQVDIIEERRRELEVVTGK